MKIRTLALISLLALCACGKKKDEAKSGAAKTAAKATDEAPAKATDEAPAKATDEAPAEAAGPVTLDKLGLKIEVPADAKISDGPTGDGVMIQAPGLVLTVGEAGQFDAESLEDDVKDATDTYSAENINKEELADGWALTFTNKGGMGTNYWVRVHRSFGDKAYSCSTTASSAEQQANALAACKSLQQ
jgi:hypothetical protein